MICDLYLQAFALHEKGIHLISTDEKTGIQARERIAADKPVRPGTAKRIEFEYVRHGTMCLIANFEVATGKVITPTIGLTRKEDDFCQHIEQTICSDREGEWIFVVDQISRRDS